MKGARSLKRSGCGRKKPGWDVHQQKRPGPRDGGGSGDRAQKPGPGSVTGLDTGDNSRFVGKPVHADKKRHVPIADHELIARICVSLKLSTT